MGHAIMVQGTASSVGKSLIAAALCRIFRQDGLQVAPFKAQNMSNNSFVAAEGGEISRSIALQAYASGLEPLARMNPVLLKPEANHRSQVVVNGRVSGTLSAKDWRTNRQSLWPVVTEGLDSLLESFDVVVIEGAGSPAEVNLKSADIVNMRVALHAECPVLLVGDIDRGGVFASLLGTLELLEPAERDLVKGLVINRFRGDRAALEPLPTMISERTGVPVVGVLPYLEDLNLPEEDAAALDWVNDPPRPIGTDRLQVAVIKFPRLSNFDDFDPLRSTPGVDVRYASDCADLEGAHLVVLPGTKSTLSDLDWMRKRGLDEAIRRAAHSGVPVIGICGGFQMLGHTVVDSGGAESEAGAETAGLRLLPMDTAFQPVKTTERVRFELNGGPGLLEGCAGIAGDGYEIHMGRTTAAKGACPLAAQYLFRDGASGASPSLRDATRRPGPSADWERGGAVSEDGRVLGVYTHGLFHSDDVRDALLGNVARIDGRAAPPRSAHSLDHELNRLAAAVRDHLDLPYLHRLIGRVDLFDSPSRT